MHEKTTSPIFVDDGGTGSVPLIFIHALAGNTAQWSAQLTHIRATRRTIALDLRGHGHSSPPADGDYSIGSMAQDILTAMDQLGIKRAILAGHSMGGSVAGAFAGAYPERVAGLLLVDPSGDSTQMPAKEVQQYLCALESDAYGEVIEGYFSQILAGSSETTKNKVMQALRDTSKETVIGVFTALLQYNPVPALGRFEGPKLLVGTACNDSPFSVHNLVTNLPHTMIPGTGHWVQIDKPKEFNQILDEFLASIGNGNPPCTRCS